MHMRCHANPSAQSMAAHSTASMDLPSNLRAISEQAAPSGTYSRCVPYGHTQRDFVSELLSRLRKRSLKATYL